MNREAIEELKKYILGKKNTEKVEISVLQLNRVIKALEQEPCEDAIGRQAVNILVDELARAISDERCFMSRGRSTATIIQDILDLPPVNPQPCEDAISRQSVDEIIKKYRDEQADVMSEICLERAYGANAVGMLISNLPPVNPQMKDQWNELKETIIEMRDNDGAGTQQEVCKFLVNLMDVLEKQMQEPKMGHWISDAIQGEIDGQIVKGFICSECGAISVFRMTGGKIVNGDLCPNCGAKMQEVEDGNND